MSGALLLAALAAVVWVRPLGWAPIDRLMEASEVQVVEQMLLGQGLVLPLLPDRELPEKPPLMHWLAAASSRFLPWPRTELAVQEAAVRLPSAFASIASVVALWLWGRRRFSDSTAALATLLFMVTYRVATMARTAWVDATFSAWVMIAIMLGFDLVEARIAATSRRDAELPDAVRDRWRAPCFWLCLAGATLTKGPLGIVLPALTLLCWSLARRRPESLGALLSPTAMALAAGLAGSWYAAAYAQHGHAFLDKQIVKSYFERFAIRDPDSPHAQPFWYFFVYFFAEAFPTSALFPLAAWDAMRHRLGHPDDLSPGGWTQATGTASAAARRAELRRFLVLWVLVFVAFFSLSAGKRKVYLLPCYPAVALLSADWVLRRTQHAAPAARARRRRLLAAGMAAAFLWAAVVQPSIDRRKWGARSYKAFAQEVVRQTSEPLAAVGIAGFFPLTVYLMPRLRFFAHLEDVPPETQQLLLASETLAAPRTQGKRRAKATREAPEPPPGWEIALSTQARSGFARRHPVLLLRRKAL